MINKIFKKPEVILLMLVMLVSATIVVMATGTQDGTATLDIAGFNSIAVVTSSLDFVECTPAPTTGSTVNTTKDTTVCTAGSEAALELGIENDGNTHLNITIKTDVISSFIGGTSPTFKYITSNGTNNPGCMSGIITTWANFTVAAQKYMACSNLTFGSTINELEADFELFLPRDAPVATNSVATITFTAHAIA